MTIGEFIQKLNWRFKGEELNWRLDTVMSTHPDGYRDDRDSPHEFRFCITLGGDKLFTTINDKTPPVTGSKK